MKKLVVAICAMAVFASCDKNDDDGVPPGTVLLTSGSWKVTTTTAVVNIPPPIDSTFALDIYAFMQQCMKDNTYKFNTDKTATMDEGATKCSPADPQTEPAGTWDLYSNDSKFKMTLQGFPVEADVLMINSTTLSFKYDTTLMGLNATATTTLTHIP